LVILEIFNDITSVHISGNKCHNNETLEIAKITSDESSKTLNLHLIGLKPFSEREWVVLSHFADSAFGERAPLDLGDGGDTLTEML